ncbi:MAG: fasciclin domain-containing protein [Geminicoccales bacterium]
MTIRSLSTLLAVLLVLAACGSSPTVPKVEADLVAVLKTRPSLKQFTKALEETGVAAALQKDGSYTIFAPIDAATGDQPLDIATIRHHIIAERITFSDIAGESTSYKTLHTDEIEIDATESISVGDGLMVESDITAINGVIHVIDTVLEPGTVPTNLNPAALAPPIPLAPPEDTSNPTQ